MDDSTVDRSAVEMTPVPELTGKFDWRRTIRIDPRAIRSGLTFKIWPDFEYRAWSVVDGEWDRASKPVEKDFRFRGVQEFLRDDLPFEQTALYPREYNPGLSSPEEFARKRSSFIRTMYEDLTRDRRLLSNRDYGADEDPAATTAEICIAIGRDGQPILADGWHRLSIARVAGIERVPARVVLRHREWAEFYEHVADTFERGFWKKRYKSYSPLDHLDFQHWECVWSDYRWQRIREHLPAKGRALDIGAMCGYFSSRLERAGLTVDAIEIGSVRAEIMRKLRDAAGLRFRIIGEPYENLALDEEYDVVLALNIFHHALKSAEGHEKLIGFLNKLNARQIFFQTHRYREKQMQKGYRDYRAKKFAKLIVKNVPTVDRVEELGEEHGRRLFRIYRS